jgi:hypothetical protein
MGKSDGSTITVDRTAQVIDSDRKGESRPLLTKVVGGASAAYSLRDLNDKAGNNKVVRVRRASDNHEKDFRAKELKDIETWVNTQIVPPLDIGVETDDGRIPVSEGGTSIGEPAAAYSLRNLRPDYTGYVVDVRRSSDDTEKSFNATEVADGTLEDWVGFGNDGYVSLWYDQTSAENDAEQSDPTKQPQIVDGGVLNSAGLSFDGINDKLSFSPISLSSDDFFATSVLSISDGDNDSVTPVANPAGNRFLISLDYDQSRVQARADDGTFLTQPFSAGTPTGDTLITAQRVGDTYTVFNRGSSAATFNATGESFTLGNLGQVNPSAYSKHFLKEIIIYDTDQSDNRTAIEANIGETYGIAGVPAYDNTVNGFVETWYDQSGNGNDATQSVAGSQPKIVDGGSLVTATNGLPAMRVSGNTQSLVLSQNLSLNNFSAFYVVKHQAIGSSISWLGDNGGVSYLRYTTDSYQIRAQGAQTAFIDFDTTISSGDDYLLSAVRGSNTLKFFIDGSAQANTVSRSGIFNVQKLFRRGGNTTQTLNGYAQELILYPSDQSANRPAIEANINNQYDIY